MIKRGYLQEIGLNPVERKIPWPYALAVLVIFFVGIGWLASREMNTPSPHSPQMLQGASVAQDPASVATPSKVPGRAGSAATGRGVA